MNIRILCIGLLALGLFLGCSETPSSPAPAAVTSKSAPSASATPTTSTSVPESAKPLTHAELVAKGRRVYLSNCTACHNLDPSKKGSLGPAVSGSSEALIEARVVHGNYPPGYKPKMDTHLMVALPYLTKDVPALSAYLEN